MRIPPRRWAGRAAGQAGGGYKGNRAAERAHSSIRHRTDNIYLWRAPEGREEEKEEEEEEEEEEDARRRRLRSRRKPSEED